MLTCIYHVYQFVRLDPGSKILTEECLACKEKTGRTRVSDSNWNDATCQINPHSKKSS